MQKKSNIFLILSISLICVILIYNFRYVPNLDRRLLSSLGSSNNTPVGEITKNFYLEQKISIDKLKNIKSTQYDNIICLNILLANYSNRSNIGEFGANFKVDDIDNKMVINAADVKDNLKHRICFDGLSASALYSANDVKIILHGITGESGSSVTAWSSTNVASGKITNKGERFNNRSLIFDVVLVNKTDDKKIKAFIIILIGALAVLTMVFREKIIK